MKTKLTVVFSAIALVSAMSIGAGEFPKSKTGTPELERLKGLAGTWTGKADMCGGPVDMTVTYRVLAAGSVVEERVFEGTPHEMVTMYYDKGGKLALTHYCALGNRPAMTLKSADAKSLTFDFDPSCGIDPAKESHMHALKISFEDADTIKTSCRAFMDGKETPQHTTTLKRVKT